MIAGMLLWFVSFFGNAAEPNDASHIHHTNRLAQEKSPYLLQHAHNPVDWYPWGQAAFEKAKAEDKLIFLSVGYSTCHWCHVMARESFENDAIAKIMNEHFVCIKVDREERPDVDRVYMNFVQATTGGGGWPMSVWLTPELKPIVGGTYFPPKDQFGRPGFASVLQQIADVWKKDREELVRRGDAIVKALQNHFASSKANLNSLKHEILDMAFDAFEKIYDEEHGGFGNAPKFPRPSVLHFLHRYALQKTAPKSKRDKANQMALFTLKQMAAGGMHDHLGGGFHRYSVDRFWHIPHFEKMLYDQAQLAIAYLEAFQITREAQYERVARGILDYVLDKMRDESGGFFCAEDADSFFEHGKSEHGEGAFYVWNEKEIREILGQSAAKRFHHFYGIQPNGNAPLGSDPHGEFVGKNILIARWSEKEFAKKLDIPLSQLRAELASSRRKLFEQRETRPRPHLDDKILTSWNGLMISAFAKAHQVLGDVKYLNAATRAAIFIKSNLYSSSTKRLFRLYRKEASSIEGFAEDYAFLIQGLLDLYESSFDIRWMKWAETLQYTQDRLFYDYASAGYFSETGKDPSILIRLKEDYDGAEPSPNSVSVSNLIRLTRIYDNPDFEKKARETLQHFSDSLIAQPEAMPQMLASLSFWFVKPKQIVFAAKPSSPELVPFLRRLHKSFLPHKMVLLADGGKGQVRLDRSIPFFKNFVQIDDKVTAYVCENFVCKLPTNDVDQFEKLIRSAP